MYRWIDHTAEVELDITSPTAEGVVADTLAALRELVGGSVAGSQPQAEPIERAVKVDAADRPALLAAWVNELVYLCDVEQAVPEEIESLELGERSLRARVRFRPGDPSSLVKSATYHRLSFEQVEDGWRATLILDV